MPKGDSPNPNPHPNPNPNPNPNPTPHPNPRRDSAAPWTHALPAALRTGYTYYGAASMHLSLRRTLLVTCDECAIVSMAIAIVSIAIVSIALALTLTLTPYRCLTASARSRFGGALAAVHFEGGAGGPNPSR